MMVRGETLLRTLILGYMSQKILNHTSQYSPDEALIVQKKKKIYIYIYIDSLSET